MLPGNVSGLRSDKRNVVVGDRKDLLGYAHRQSFDRCVPDGEKERFDVPRVDKHLVIVQGEGTPENASAAE